MNREEIIQALKDYRSNCAKINRLKYEIDQASCIREPVQASGLYPNQQLTGMPHGSKISKPTERAAMDGWNEYGDLTMFSDNNQEAEQKTKELALAENEKKCVDIMLEALYDKERFVAENHLIAGMSWVDTGKEHEKRYGYFLARRTAQDLQSKAIEKMEIACPSIKRAVSA